MSAPPIIRYTLNAHGDYTKDAKAPKSKYHNWRDNVKSQDTLSREKCIYYTIDNVAKIVKPFDKKRVCCKKVRTNVKTPAISTYSLVVDQKVKDKNYAFIMLSEMSHKDKDAGLMQESSLPFTNEDGLKLFKIMCALADDLFPVVKNYVFNGIPSLSEKYNLLFHIIAYGEGMYNAVMKDYEFGLVFASDKYVQPFFDVMVKKYKINESVIKTYTK